MNIVKLLWPVVSVLFIHSGLYGQSNEEKIRAIRQEFQKINGDSSLQSITLDDPEDFLGHGTDGGGELTGYFRKDSIRKIVIAVGLSYGEIADEYYFRNGRLIFVYETEKHFPYDDSSGINHEKLNLAFEGRYYFDKNKLISKIEKGSRRFAGKKDAQQFLAEAAEYVKLLRSGHK